MKKELLSIQEAARFLKVSRPTFNRIRAQKKIPEYVVGKRVFYNNSDLVAYIENKSKSSFVSAAKQFAAVGINLLSEQTIDDLEIRENVFDLRRIKFIDSFGIISLLTTIIEKGKEQKVQLVIDDSYWCGYFDKIGFFHLIENACKENVSWEKNIVQQSQMLTSDVVLPIMALQKGTEKNVTDRLVTVLQKQGFGSSVGGYLSWVFGELLDNIFTHSHALLSKRICYLLISRYLIDDHNCLSIALADLGCGIPQSLKTNPKYSAVSDERALIESFKTYVSSWDDAYQRGKGLTDVMKIAMGNRSFFRVESGGFSFLMDFRDPSHNKIERKRVLSKAVGTRFGLSLIDHDFVSEVSRENV